MNETFMKEKPILPLLTSMALPMVISMMVNALYNIVDSLFVARINENAMTALSLVFPIQNFVNALAIGLPIFSEQTTKKAPTAPPHRDLFWHSSTALSSLC